ncbi:MAG TPA: YetF domain-containing protein [Gaiellaceae bacterium]
MDIVARATVAFLFIFFVTRIVGRRELSTLEPFDLILLVVMGDIIQQGVTQNDFSVTGLLLAGSTIAVMTVLFSYLSFRVSRLRPILAGEPLILVEDGELIERNLTRQRITVGELLAEARMQQITKLDQIQWAVLETSGQISFVKRS